MKNQSSLSENNEVSETESIPAALWRTFRSSVILFVLASLATGIFCWLGNRRTLYDFGSAFFLYGRFACHTRLVYFRS